MPWRKMAIIVLVAASITAFNFFFFTRGTKPRTAISQVKVVYGCSQPDGKVNSLFAYSHSCGKGQPIHWEVKP